VCITYGDALLCLDEVKTREEARRMASDWRRAVLSVTEPDE